MKKKIFATLLSFCTILSFILTGCSPSTGEATPTPYPTKVRKTYTVGRGDIVIDVDLFGQVVPKTLSTAYFQMSGHVAEVYVQVNDIVKKGQLLADLTELQDIQAKTSEVRIAVQRAQITVENAQLLLEKYKAEHRQDFDVKMQENQVKLAQIDLEEILVKYGIDLDANPFDALDAQVAKAKLFAPEDGVIITAVSTGRAVTTTTPAFTIGDGQQMEIVVNLTSGESSGQVKDMYEGMPVSVSPNDKPDLEWAGEITQLPSPYGTGGSNDQTIHVVLDEIPAGGDYKISDTVTVVVELANKKNILWLPPAAIRTVGGRTFVIVNGENGPMRVDIEIGLKTNDKIEILSGLTEGQVVVGP
jgi:macrolide-specific efflux system membrane fusion protein